MDYELLILFGECLLILLQHVESENYLFQISKTVIITKHKITE